MATLAYSTTCYDPATMIFSSPRPPVDIPDDIDMVSFLFRKVIPSRAYHHRLAIADAFTGESLTFLQLYLRVQAVARGLSLAGVRQGDVVLILSSNSVHFPVVFFAVISLGAIATTVNPISTPGEISKQISNSKTSLVLSVPELVDKVSKCGLPVVLIAGSPSSTFVSIDDLVKKAEAASHRTPRVTIRQSDTAALLYSSGTTGVSKGVIVSHRNFIASALQVNCDAELAGETDLTFLCIIPMFHVYGLAIIVFGQLQRGNTLVTMPKFDFQLMLESVQKYRISSLPIVPPIIIGLAKHEVATRYDLSSVIDITSGAAPVGKDTLEEVFQRFNVRNIRQGYGMTETSGIISIPILNTENPDYATVGPLVSRMQGVVVDPTTGRRCPPNQQGEIWVRGPNIMQGYLNNPEATASTLDKDGWLHTGDLGYIDSEGKIYILDRLKELIKVKAFQVAPAELEALLLTHPEIVDAAVVPFPDREAGELPMAFVVRLKGSLLKEDAVMEFVAAQVSPYKRIRRVRFVDAIPKSSSGKILRRELVQQATSRL